MMNYPVQIVVYHVFMVVYVCLLVRQIHARRKKRDKPVSLVYIFAMSCCGALGSLFFAFLVGPIGDEFFTGQRFAEGLFFEGAFFLFLVGAYIASRLNSAPPRLKTGLAIQLFAILTAFIGINSLYYEPWAICVKTYTLQSDKIMTPIKVVLIADIQTDSVGKYERKSLQLAKEQNGDLILFGGDYLQWKGNVNDGVKQLNELMKEVNFDAPLGCYAVRGNVDFNNNWPEIFADTKIKATEKTGTIILEKDGCKVALSLLSIYDSRELGKDRMMLDGYEAEKSESNPYHIMLGHDPSFAGFKTDADLLLAGHTHGGQVCIPFYGPIITLAKGLPRSSGYEKTLRPDGSTLIISNGVGMERREAPRIRFWCPPQIVVVNLLPKRVQ